MRGAGPDAVASGEVLDQAAEFCVDGPRGRDGAGVGRLRDPQHFDAVAPDAAVHAERQLIAFGVVWQPVKFERATVAHGWPAGFVRWAVIHLEWEAGIVRRCTGFFF